MATFAIFQIGRPERQTTLDKPEILLGRDETCDVALPELLVSRRHALVRTQGGRTVLEPLAEKNPTVLNGEVIREPTPLEPGDEIQLGCFLLVYSERVSAPLEEREVASYRAKCAGCKKWEGTVTRRKAQPRCPECGSGRLLLGERLVPQTAAPAAGPIVKKAVMEAETRALGAEDVVAYQDRVRRASLAYLVSGEVRYQLQSDHPARLGRAGKETDVPLSGFGTLLGHALVSWKGTSYLIESHLPFASLKVNGATVKESRLKSGDVIEIGSNRFTLVVGEG